MNPQLQEMIAEADRQREQVTALLDALDDQAFSRRAGPGRWSVGEQIAHVALTDRPYLAAIEAALREGRARDRRSGGPFKGGMLGNWFARALEPPPRRRLRTRPDLMPPPGLERHAVRDDFAACRRELAATIASAADLDLDRIKIRSPFLSLLKMPVFSAFHVLLAHGRRHIWNATRTLEQGFPERR